MGETTGTIVTFTKADGTVDVNILAPVARAEVPPCYGGGEVEYRTVYHLDAGLCSECADEEDDD